jgi:phosphoglycolate phosphatase
MFSADKLLILDADGSTIDAFSAIETTFRHHGMDIGDLERFQKRRNLFKYLGGIKEFPTNLRKQLGKRRREALIDTLTQVYREETRLYPGMRDMIQRLESAPHLRVGLVTRNITHEPKQTLKQLFRREGVDVQRLDFFIHVPLREEKSPYFGQLRVRFEDHRRLTEKVGVPGALISRTPEELCGRILHAFDLASPETLAMRHQQNAAAWIRAGEIPGQWRALSGLAGH